jgi:hypothetical protein
MRPLKQMRTGLGLTALIMVLALTGTGAQATGGGRIVSACSNETVAVFGKPVTLRFVLLGVSCSKAHSLIRTYFHDATPRNCRNAGTACILTLPGHWGCSFTFAGVGAEFASCFHSPVDRFAAYRVSAPAPPSLNGPIVIAASCAGPLSTPGSLCSGQIGAKARDYTPSFGAGVGSHHPDHDSAVLDLIKGIYGKRGYQSHGWGVNLLPSQVRIINRSKVLIEVKHPIGHHGADGKIDFTFRGGRLHTRSICGSKYHQVIGTITGTIQIRVHDRFFKTITITRMRALARDSLPDTCPPSLTCSRPGYFLGGSTPPQSSPYKREVSVSAAKPPSSLSSPLAVDVTEPHIGTPFTVIDADMVLGGTKTFLSLGPNLTSAKLRTPGGVISGGLRVQAYGIATTFPEPCKVGHDQITIQPAHVTKGKVTAKFDSIGKVSIGTNSTFQLESIKRVP